MHFLLLNSERVGFINVVKTEINTILCIKPTFCSKVQIKTIASYCLNILSIFFINKKVRYGQKNLVMIELSWFYTEKNQKIEICHSSDV